jgi:Plasmid maintenance system antidote protein
MSVAEKKRPIESKEDSVEVRIGARRVRTFVLPRVKANGLIKLLEEYEVTPARGTINPKSVSVSLNTVSLDNVFPELFDDAQRPGLVLRGLRLRDGLTQSKLAEQVGVTQSAIAGMESGARPIGKKMAQRLAKALSTDHRVFL